MALACAASRDVRVQRRAARPTAFYRDELGFSLVKKTVNFDDPHSYHLYFGDEDASPGILLTFFEWPRAERGRLGRGTFESIGLVSPAVHDGVAARGSRRPAAARAPGRAAGAARRGRDRQPDPLRRAARRGRADPLRAAGRGGRADRRRHHPPHRLARRRRRRAGASGATRLDRARPAADGRRRTASTSARSTSACPTGSCSRSRPTAPGFLVDEPRRRRSARASRCRRGSRPSARRSSASSRRSAERRLDCRPPTRWWRNW